MMTWQKLKYRLYLRSLRWFAIRAMRKAIDNHRCARCGSRKRLQVHHKSYRNKGKGTGVAELMDCVTLCRRCHRRAHGRG